VVVQRVETSETGRNQRPSPAFADSGWRALRAHLRGDMLLATLALNFTGLALPLAMLQIYDRIIPNAALTTLTLMVTGLIAAIVIDGVLRQLRSQVSSWDGARYEYRTYRAAVDQMLDADVAQVERTPIGIHLDRMTRIESLRDFYASQSTLLLVDMPFVLLFLGLMAYIGGAMVLAPLVLILVFGSLCLLASLGLRDAVDERSQLDDRRYNFILEVLSGIHTIKTMAMERMILRRYERLVNAGAVLGLRINLMSNTIQNLSSGFAQTTTVVVAGVGCVEVILGQVSVGALAACTVLAGRVVQPVLRLIGIWARYQTVKLSETRLTELADVGAERGAEAQTSGPIQRLELRSVTFGHNPDQPLYRDVNLHVETGEIIGICGANGSGKSTLLWMLMGGALPQEGEALVNGIPMQNLTVDSVRSQMAHLPQKAQLFEGTVLENMCRFDIDANINQALQLADALGLDRVFANMSEGYETRVGEGGVMLPPGVAQRWAWYAV
jgi:ATP-binding cassette, subfamily C, bacterial LapB